MTYIFPKIPHKPKNNSQRQFLLCKITEDTTQTRDTSAEKISQTFRARLPKINQKYHTNQGYQEGKVWEILFGVKLPNVPQKPEIPAQRNISQIYRVEYQPKIPARKK